MFKALGGKDARDAQMGAQSLLDQVRAFNSGQAAAFAASSAAGSGERPAQFFQASILFTLYNANRHRSETIQS
jgi:hypothetical protein